ncbi:MAG: hypothetical protein CSB55_05970 [Candidatus Cloacimonadota bacterium]|nr:MAG: hypothetical protein CSB55_05970 [Candidatus Cloacimonadota bacterium]
MITFYKKIFFLFILSSFFIFPVNGKKNGYSHDESEFYLLSKQNFAPFEYRNKSGRLSGKNIELFRKISLNAGKSPVLLSEPLPGKPIFSFFYGDEKPVGKFITEPVYKINFISLKQNKNKKNKNIYSLNHPTIVKKLNLSDEADYRFYDNKLDLLHDFESDPYGIIVIDEDEFKQLENISEYDVEKYIVENNFESLNARLQTDEKYFFVGEEINSVLRDLRKKDKTDENKKKSLKSIFSFPVKYKFRIIGFIIFAYMLFTVYLGVKLLVARSSFVLQRERNKLKVEKLGSDLYAAETALQEIKNSEKTLLNSIGNIIIFIDADGNILYANQMLESELGYCKDDWTNMNLKDFFPEEEVNKILNLFKGDRKSQNLIDNEICLTSKSGINKNFIFSSGLMKRDDDKFIINCSLHDITGKKELEVKLENYANHLEDLVEQRTRSLKDSEERFRMVVEHTNDGIILVENEKIIYYNKIFSDLTKENSNSLDNVGLTIDMLASESDKEKLLNCYGQVHRKEENFVQAEVRMKLGDKFFYANINITSITLDDKKTELFIVRDITKEKLAEMERIERDKLLTAAQFAVTANDGINSPLNSILGFAEMIQIKYGDFKDIVSYTDSIMKSVKIIEKLLHKLKSMTEISLKDYKLENIKMLDLENKIESIKEGKENEQN